VEGPETEDEGGARIGGPDHIKEHNYSDNDQLVIIRVIYNQKVYMMMYMTNNKRKNETIDLENDRPSL